MKELNAEATAPVGYPVPRRAVLAGSVAAGALAWASRLAGPAAAQTSRDLGRAGGPGNVRVSRDAFTMHAEPSLAANPVNPGNLLAACMVWQAGQRGLATYVSFDAGRTWHSNGLLPGIRPAYDGDVTVAFDGRGTGYVSGWAGSHAAEQRGRACAWRTADGGRSFTTPVTVATGLIDHPSLGRLPLPARRPRGIPAPAPPHRRGPPRLRRGPGARRQHHRTRPPHRPPRQPGRLTGAFHPRAGSAGGPRGQSRDEPAECRPRGGR